MEGDEPLGSWLDAQRSRWKLGKLAPERGLETSALGQPWGDWVTRKSVVLISGNQGCVELFSLIQVWVVTSFSQFRWEHWLK